MTRIKEIADKSTWETFNLGSSSPTFLQSWVWGEFQKNLGRNTYRLGLFEKNDLIGISLLVEERAKIGSFLYCPGGPILSNWKSQYLKAWLEYISKLAKERNSIFLRVDPRTIEKSKKSLLYEFGFTSAPEYTQPQCTAIIDLSISEEELRHGLSDSTRYNVNAAERKGVKVRVGRKKEISVFLDILKETAQRKALVLPREDDYHTKQFESLGKEGIMKLFIAENASKPLSAALVVNYAGIAYYLHAANSLQQKNLRASYPLVWHIILESKREGAKSFDFWGVAPSDDSKHPWAGVTSFKLSFGAKKICYEPPFDLPYKSNYQLMRLVEIWRKPMKKILRFRR